MNSINEKLSDIERDMSYFEKMVDGADRIVDRATKPWKWAVICMVVAVVLCNIVWGCVHAYFIRKAYEEPYELEFSQSQEMPDQTQEQSAKGVS